ncbi:MAG: hypothetical protein FJZ01_04140 [Candidatus Sericytochromatia bacterium]|nr:hypothetical protein [Candidatus Tanganyikabacteria bacterium]
MGCRLEIKLDGAPRAYRLGDAIAGRIAVAVDADCHCQRLVVSCEWRTQGEGVPEQGGTSQVELFRGAWPAGHKEAFPFRFKAPAGPVSWEGETFSVAWFLRAHADLRHADETAEREIQVVAAEGATPDHGPTYAAPPPIRSDARSPSEPYWWLLVGLCFTGLGLAMFAVLLGAVADLPLPVMTRLVFGQDSPFLAPFLISIGGMGVGLGMMGWQVLADWRLGPLGASRHDLSPQVALPGDALACEIEFRPRYKGKLEGIWVSLFREERVFVAGRRSEPGTWKTARAGETEYQMAGPRELRKGVAAAAKGILYVPRDAAPTFEAEHHAVIWFVRFLVRIAGQPEFARKFRVTVRPVAPPPGDEPGLLEEIEEARGAAEPAAAATGAEPAAAATGADPAAAATEPAQAPAAGNDPPAAPPEEPARKETPAGLQALLAASDDLPPELQGGP